VKPQRGWLEPQQKEAVRRFERRIGRRLDIYHFFVPMGRPLGWNVEWAVSTGRIPMISWHGLNSREVLQGRHDRYIKRFAASLRPIRSPMFIRYGWEMDGTANQSWVVSPEDFVASWRYIHDRLRGVRAVWVWAPNASAFEGSRGGADPYYPGDAYVDWIAADGFNWAACKGRPWEEFSDLFAAFYRWGSSRDKPLMVPATGSVEDPTDPGRKAAWFEEAARAIASMPRIKAFVYFHSDRDCPWWVDSSSSALEGFKRFARGAVG
jgi:beta-mannanase